jgi:hypothetical protein
MIGIEAIPTPVGIQVFIVGDNALRAKANRDARTRTLITPPGIKTLAKAMEEY